MLNRPTAVVIKKMFENAVAKIEAENAKPKTSSDTEHKIHNRKMQGQTHNDR